MKFMNNSKKCNRPTNSSKNKLKKKKKILKSTTNATWIPYFSQEKGFMGSRARDYPDYVLYIE